MQIDATRCCFDSIGCEGEADTAEMDATRFCFDSNRSEGEVDFESTRT
jgi:hypothetical protein